MTGSELSTQILIEAYSRGFFPMPSEESDQINWYQPDPRAVLPLDSFHVSRSLKRRVRSGIFRATYDRDFAAVMAGCANRPDTWITADFHRVYGEMHRIGLAHSVECWMGEELVGGVYGVSLGAAFFAESKFSTATDASKYALWALVQQLQKRGFRLLEVQFQTPHLQRLGVVTLSGSEYQAQLAAALSHPCTFLD